MKAFLLAAGLGSRLRPLTDEKPKCLLPIGATTLLDRWLDAFDLAGVSEVLVNTHHLADQVERHLEARNRPPAVRTVYEPELLGSAGTLVANRDWVEGEPFFLACNADNLTDFDLGTLVDAHLRAGEMATLTLFRASDPTACGIVQLDERGRMIEFVEKPAFPKGDLANAGMYVFTPAVIDLCPERLPRDIGFDLLPLLVGKAHSVVIDSFLRDIGTMDGYREAAEDWALRSAL
ncbi:MAG: nucleotidyltransferase family protein [Acidimicrobiales bacterium]